MLRVINVEDLQAGMYVNSVVEQTGKLKIKSKGVIKTPKAIETLKSKGVLKIEIDDAKSIGDAAPAAEPPTEASPPVRKKEKPIKDQLGEASKLYDGAKSVQSGFIERIKLNESPELSVLHNLSLDIIDSVIETPNALTCLSLLQKTDEYLVEHSLNCSVLLTVFGTHMAFDAHVVEDLGFAGLLMDVGMANIPDDITHKKEPLTKTERDIVSTHVDIGVDIVERCGDASDMVREIIYGHHERVNGTGYPDYKEKDDISEYVQMAGIVDSYDAMTTARPYRDAMTPTKALKELMGDPRYDKALVTQFIQCLGVHPPGSLVKLSNDRLAIVLKTNKKSPLKPLVVTFYSIKSGAHLEPKITNLASMDVDIISAVKPEEFSINLTKFLREVFVP